MSRYIDADALKKDIARLHALNDENEIRRAYAFNPHSTSTDFEETLVSVFDAIDETPSIDAVSVVRCKDCVFSKVCCRPCYKSADSYCSDGERKGE